MAWCRIKLRDADSRASEYAKSRVPSRVPNIHNTKKTKYLERQLERNLKFFLHTYSMSKHDTLTLDRE